MFNCLKKAFTTAPILTHWIPNAPLVVETDASDYALAAILSTCTSDGDLHPIAFHSRTFTAPELNYNVHDKELLAIFEAFQHWRHYLEGSASQIDVVTDHKNLEYLEDVQIDNQPQNLEKYQMYFKRWVIILTLGVYNWNVQKFFECLQTF